MTQNGPGVGARAPADQIAKLELRLRWLAGGFTDDYLERRALARAALKNILRKDPLLANCTMGPRPLRQALAAALTERRTPLRHALKVGGFPLPQP